MRQLREIEERINETLDAIDKKRTAEIDLLSELDDLDRDLNMKQQRVAKTKKRLDQLTRDLSDQKRKLEERQKDVDKLQARVQQRLVALYKSEETGTLKTIFSSTSTSQMIEDYDFLGRIVGHDRTLLDDYRQRLKERQNAIRKLAAIRDSQQKALAELQRDEKALVETRDLKKRFLAAVRRDRTALNSVMTELRKRAAA